MPMPTGRRPNRLPQRLPVGATYVVEGFGGEQGKFRVVARYVVLPGGERINVPSDLARPPSRMLPFRRRGGAKRASPKNQPRDSSKKIAARRGTA